MSAKDKVNATMVRFTGYHLARGQQGERIEALQRQVHRLRRALGSARRERSDLAKALTRNAATLAKLETKIPAAPPSPEGTGMPTDYDAAARAIILAVRPYTMTSNEKLFGLIQATRFVARHRIEGDVVEFGVWRGGSMHAVARTLLEMGDTSRHLYMFDTYEGMTEPTEVDVRWDGRSAEELLRNEALTTRVWAIASVEDVQEGFEQVAYPRDKLHYVVGKVEDTVPGEVPERISILRLDTDWYESTKHELENAYSRLTPGGILIIDDYGDWAGARKATDEFLAALDEPILLHRMSGGRIGVKPLR